MLDELEICDILSARPGRAEVIYQSGTFINRRRKISIGIQGLKWPISHIA